MRPFIETSDILVSFIEGHSKENVKRRFTANNRRDRLRSITFVLTV